MVKRQSKVENRLTGGNAKSRAAKSSPTFRGAKDVGSREPQVPTMIWKSAVFAKENSAQAFSQAVTLETSDEPVRRTAVR